ncbi:formate dehydrogenase subunit gamma [Noviherbaspirillum galbum]|uniref:Formate dehydrogenase subunit gamma n=1 Tax=Noviherbaspirillum galbum TaxID=2709383 RepID=A0A6B3SW92_9BURK|nr:formate dehydrogenase subunit gamma [Noviherbaspirillum galbum]NEX63206.1 formate dehydrogenase subunit gamma [Noviherbaspirillum galbum]
MKRLFAVIALGISLAAVSGAQAQAQDPGKPAAAAAPNVESIDILKQNQAERTRDQPGNNAPTWRIVKEGTQNYSSLPYKEAGILIQPKAQFPGQEHATTAGEAWRRYRNGPLITFGGWLLIAALAALLAIYVVKGPARNSIPPTGRLIERFTPTERFVHWSVAISFSLLGLSGLVMAFGRHVLMPLFGHTLFGWLAYLCKNIHNFVGPVFLVSTVVFFAVYVRDNLPGKSDLHWLSRLGGVLGKDKHASSGRFNAGEKIWFWGGLTVLGLVVSASGFVLDKLVPGMPYLRGDMQVAHVIHLIGAVLFIAGAFGHIYMGTLGSEGAYKGMREGYVDDAWAMEHHDLWYEQIQRGDIPRIRSREERPETGAPAKA